MQWKKLKVNQDYEVSDTGLIRHVRHQKLRKLYNKSGYLTVTLAYSKAKRQRSFRVHRLVAEAFLDDYDELREVDHINRVRSDNSVGNLRMSVKSLNRVNRGINVATIEKVIELSSGGMNPEEILRYLRG